MSVRFETDLSIELFKPIKYLLGSIAVLYLVMLLFIIYGFFDVPENKETLILGLLLMLIMLIFAVMLYAYGRFRSLSLEEDLVLLIKAILAC